MEDFEYLKALSDAGDAQRARDLASALFPDAWTEPAGAALLSARRTIAERILALTHPAPPGDSTTPPGGADPATASSPAVRLHEGSAGCSSGAAGQALAGLGVFAALAVRRRRRSRAAVN